MITSHQITNYYLYGSSEKPAELVTDELIRTKDATTEIDIDTLEYMSLGPGRFANPAMFEVIQKFFNPSTAIESSNLLPGTYDKNSLFSAFGIERGGLVIQQWMFDDGKDDMVERAYIWNTVQFQIDPNSRFIISETGARSIENFAIIPRVKEGAAENFDFIGGDGMAEIANPQLEAAIDPSGIGRTVILNFSGEVPLQTFTQSDYQSSLSTLTSVDPFSAVEIATAFPSFVTELWNGGSSNTVDPDGRVILYGTSHGDTLSETKISSPNAARRVD